MDKLRVLLVDDELLLLESLEIILSLEGNMQVVGKARDGKQAIEILQQNDCDVVLLDLNMNVMGGLAAIPHIKKIRPNVKILVLTTFYDEVNIKSALSLGADGYLLKGGGKDIIINAVQNAAKGYAVLDEKIMKKLCEFIGNPRIDNSENIKQSELFRELTKRESEICFMIAEGYTNTQISEKLYIAEGTVKNYISSIYEKTGIKERSLLAVSVQKLLSK